MRDFSWFIQVKYRGLSGAYGGGSLFTQRERLIVTATRGFDQERAARTREEPQEAMQEFVYALNFISS